MLKKIIWANFQRMKDLLPKKLSKSSQEYGFGIRDPRSGIRKKPIPDPGSRGQKGTGSRIRIRNTESMTRIRIPIGLALWGKKLDPGPHGNQCRFTMLNWFILVYSVIWLNARAAWHLAPQRYPTACTSSPLSLQFVKIIYSFLKKFIYLINFKWA